MAEVTQTAGKSDVDAELSRDYSLGSLLLFVLPSIFTFVFIAFYQIADGFFISKYVGPYAISAVNLYYPVISLLLAVGTMLGTGGNATIVKLLGEGKKDEADSAFTQTVFTALALSAVFAVSCLIFKKPFMYLLGATDGNIEYLEPYYMLLSAFAPAIMLQTILGVLIIGEGKTVLTGVLIILGGVSNIVLDYVFMGRCGMGIRGAAIATVTGYVIPVLYALYFYSPKGGSKYRLRFTRFQPKLIGGICFNGSSEMVSNLAAGVTALLMNHLALSLCGEVGVSVVSVFLYVQFIVIAVFMGMTTAVEPLFSYHFGSGNVAMRRKLYRMTLIWTAVFSLILAVIVFLFRAAIVNFFFDDAAEEGFVSLGLSAIFWVAPACLFTGFNVFASGLFTAFSDGMISGLLSAVRTFVILSICLFVMAKLFGSSGLWAAWAVAEALSLAVSLFFLFRYRKKYQY